MNLFQKALLTIAGFRNLENNKYYSSILSGAFGGFVFSKGNEKKFINEGYASNNDLYAVINKIARTAASVPIEVVVTDRDGNEEVITDPNNGLVQLMACPNRLQTGPEYREEALTYLLTNGNSYTAGTQSAGFGEAFRELNVLPAHHTTPVVGNEVNPIAGYIMDWDFRTKYGFEEVMHLKYFNPQGTREQSLVGLSPLQAGWKNLEASNHLQTADAALLENRGATGILTSRSERSMTAEQGEKLTAAIREKLGGASKYGQVSATSANVDYIPIGFSPTDLKLLDNYVIKLREFCNLYSVDSSLFNDPANKTFNNRKEATKSLYTEAVLPTLERLITGLNIWLVPEWSKQDGVEYKLRAKINNIDALQEDRDKEAQRKERTSKEVREIVKNVALGQTKPDDARAMLEIIHNFTTDEAQKIIT